MKKCSKCDKKATTDNGLCNLHFSEWAAAADGADPQEIVEELVCRFGPDFEWFSDFFDANFKYTGQDREKIYEEAYRMIKSMIETAYDYGTLDGPDDEEDYGDDD